MLVSTLHFTLSYTIKHVHTTHYFYQISSVAHPADRLNPSIRWDRSSGRSQGHRNPRSDTDTSEHSPSRRALENTLEEQQYKTWTRTNIRDLLDFSSESIMGIVFLVTLLKIHMHEYIMHILRACLCMKVDCVWTELLQQTSILTRLELVLLIMFITG